MRRSMGQRLTATELAGSCCVPERTLHRHFLSFTGHAPLVHFRLMRLTAVREALLAPGDQTAAVTGIATRYGFAHLGRRRTTWRVGPGRLAHAIAWQDASRDPRKDAFRSSRVCSTRWRATSSFGAMPLAA